MFEGHTLCDVLCSVALSAAEQRIGTVAMSLLLRFLVMLFQNLV